MSRIQALLPNRHTEIVFVTVCPLYTYLQYIGLSSKYKVLCWFLLPAIFFYLKESECKAYNPRPFCKTYTMDKQPLNTGEQKDMTEFFTDLITKIEEMSPELVS